MNLFLSTFGGMSEVSFLGGRVEDGSGECEHSALPDESLAESQLVQEGLSICSLETKDPAEVVART